MASRARACTAGHSLAEGSRQQRRADIAESDACRGKNAFAGRVRELTFRRVSLAGLDARAGRQSNRRARCASVFIRRVTTAGTDNSERKPAATHGACECRPPGRCGDCRWRQESLAGRTPTSSRRLAHFRMEDAHVLHLPLSFQLQPTAKRVTGVGGDERTKK